MNLDKVLEGKRTIVLGASGSIGSAVAIELSAAGAEVVLAGRNRTKLDDLAARIRATRGRAHVEEVDALDDAAVCALMAKYGKDGLDVVFGAIGPLATDYGVNKYATELTIDEFMLPLTTVVRSQFIMARAAARVMKRQRSGLIIFLTGSPARGHAAGSTAIGTAFGAIESLMENLAIELGPTGVRTVCLRTTANTDSRTIQSVMDDAATATGRTKEQLIAGIANMNVLKRPATVHDTAKAVVLLASDYGAMLSATTVNFTAGAAAD